LIYLLSASTNGTACSDFCLSSEVGAVMNDRTVFLMYHEIEAVGRALCEPEPGYVRYAVSEIVFRRQLAHLRAGGYSGISVGQALAADYDEPAVVITFDDGCETDALVAAPLLAQFGFKATFYVIAGRVGLRGYLSPAQLRELSVAGFEIGCHSMTHSYMDELNDAQLRIELAEAKDRLEQITHSPVAHFSCPGGRWSRSLARSAAEVGYASIATSRVDTNTPMTSRFNLARVAVMRDMDSATFARIVRGEGLTARRARAGLLNAAKAILGNSAYERVRARVLPQS
jgi:peptidoglycan/xylan/chitin deacetylase (PgdA/CDA1 family)